MVNRRRREREKEGTWSLGRKSARKSWVLNREKWSRFLVKLVGESFANKLVVRIYIKFSMFLFSFLLNFAFRGEEECKSPLLHGNTIIVTSTYVWNIYSSLNVTIWSRKRFFLKIRTLYSSPFSTFKLIFIRYAAIFPIQKSISPFKTDSSTARRFRVNLSTIRELTILSKTGPPIARKMHTGDEVSENGGNEGRYIRGAPSS